MNNPVLLWCTSRSRSSLVAKIFINHGLWWGDECRESFGYPTFENQNIKALIKSYKRNIWKIQAKQLAPADANFIDELKSIVPNDRQWMFKCGAEYFQPFQALEPFNIFIKRNLEDAVRSVCAKHGAISTDDARDIIQWRYNFMDTMRKLQGGMLVDTDRLMAKDFSQIKKAIEYCGLTFSAEKTLQAFV